MLPRLPPRPRDWHKGQAGRILVVAGARGMAGAAALCARGALRAGAGLVTVAAPEGIVPVLAAKLDEATTLPLPETEAGTLAPSALPPLRARLAESDVAAVGPGLGRHPATGLFLERLLTRLERPFVLDADGLNLVAAGGRDALAAARPPRILTPHPGEMARLLGVTIAAVQADRAAAAREAARRFHAVVALKGAGTVVTDGEDVYVNRTGNPGMATGGTGDVLTGVAAALLGQGLEAYEAAVLAVHVHGLAGDLAAAALGEVSLTAGDLVRCLPRAFRRLEAGGP